MLKRQEHAIERVIKRRASIDETRRQVDKDVYQAVRVEGVPVQVLADRLGLTRARVYQMVNNGAVQLDG